MTVKLTSTATQLARIGTRALGHLPRHASAVAVLALVAGTAWQVPIVAPLAARAATRPIAPSPAPSVAHPKAAAAAVPLAADDGDDQDDEEQAEDGPPPEPQLEQIPVVPAAGPQAIDVSDRALRRHHLPRT